jgi:hypothetical protein
LLVVVTIATVNVYVTPLVSPGNVSGDDNAVCVVVAGCDVTAKEKDRVLAPVEPVNAPPTPFSACGGGQLMMATASPAAAATATTVAGICHGNRIDDDDDDGGDKPTRFTATTVNV